MDGFAEILKENNTAQNPPLQVEWPKANFECGDLDPPAAPLLRERRVLRPIRRPRKPAMDVQRLVIGLGLVLLVIGGIWPMLSRIGLGRLPGDIMFQRGGTTFYFPVVTCIIISILLSALF